MNQFAPILPELIVTVGAIALMMVAAFGGRRSGGFTSWASVAVLIAATLALVGPPTNAGGVFGGLITADLFGSFGKVIIFIASAVSSMLSPPKNRNSMIWLLRGSRFPRSLSASSRAINSDAR